MKGRWEQLEQALGALRGYADVPSGVAALARAARATKPGELPAFDEVLAAFNPDSIRPADLAQNHYSAVIANLYGLFESYVEDLIGSLVLELGRTASGWNDLPEALRRNNTTVNLDLIGAIHDGRRSFEDVTLEIAISRLSTCVSDDGNFSLTPEAFSFHSANFRHETIVQAFGRLGARVSTVDEEFTNRLSKLGMELPADWASPISDELVWRRNQVAHGRPTNLLSPELLQALIDAVGVYLRVLSEAVVDFAIHNSLRLGHLKELGRPDRRFQGGRVLGYESAPIDIAEGQQLAVVPGRGWARLDSAMSLQVDGEPVDSVSVGEAVGIGLIRAASGRSRVWVVPDALHHGSVLLDAPFA